MNSTEVQKSLIAAYEKLDVGMQQVLQVAAADQPISRSPLLTLAANVGVVHENGSVPSYKNDGSALNKLIDQGLLNYRSKSNGPVVVSELLIDYVFRKAFGSGIVQKVDELKESRELRPTSRHYLVDDSTIGRKTRMAFYGNDVEAWRELNDVYRSRPNVLDPFCLDTFRQLDAELQDEFLNVATERLIHFGDTRRAQIAVQAIDIAKSMKRWSDGALDAAINLFSARGDISGLQYLATQVASSRSEIQGCIDFLQGNYDQAESHFEAAISETKKRTKKRRIELPYMPLIFYGLLLLKRNTPQSQKKLNQVIDTITKWDGVYWIVHVQLEDALQCRLHPLATREQPFLHVDERLPCLVGGWNWCWFYADQKPPISKKQFEALLKVYKACELTWFAAELSAVLSQLPNTKRHRAYADTTHAELKTASLVDFIKPLSSWEAALVSLENLCDSLEGNGSQNSDAGINSGERLIWELDHGVEWISLTPFIQKLGKKGWSKGRKVGLSRLYAEWQSPSFDFLTEQDHSICKLLHERVERNYYGYRETYYEWIQGRIGDAIAGHPHIYWSHNRDEPIQISVSTPHLRIEQKGQKIQFDVEPKIRGESQTVRKIGSHRVDIIRFSDRQKEIAELVVDLPAIPAQQIERVASIAQSISSEIDVQSDVEGAKSSGEEVTASSKLVVQLTPYQDGLRAEIFVQPLGEHGPFCRPGIGATSVLANINGKPLTTTRDLGTERRNLAQLLEQCHPLACRTINDEQFEWLFDEAEDALDLVTDLQSLSDQIVVLWPRGKTHDVAGSASNSNFQIAVKRDRDWFAASGELKVDNELTLDLMKLFELVSDSPSRFLQLDDGRFLALTKELRQRIVDIAAYGTAMKNKMRFSPVRALVVDELLEDTNFKADKHWKSHISRIEESSEVPVDPPSTLQAELREYQADGYAWLKRMTHWNSGACLADDMGLGKTIQALALIIERANDGPTLVVAPASVGFNWESETHKFAPTLVPKLFRDCDRDEFFEDIQSGDVAITSYGLLQSEIKRFKQVHWRTIVLDEAQAIKNMATKRSQAVMQLEGDFKLILTGTPMENHLGELWNLFRFIVPGLLGSNDDFRNRFAIPIERDKCRQTQGRLKKLIQPFLLRRNKSEVLSELPPRSESMLEVELSPKETALYEALRRKAIENIEEAAADSTADGQQHLKVLAELTRLRLACCHPSLVGGEGIESTKLQLFRQKVGEIIEGKHKVLVFSQFVKHLQILREELDSMGVSYQYLDGSTSMKNRKQAVDAFQSGKGDVFLISLKAGGTGLNLTAADYVIHMDPWWNPAVEDQATDRAHRIGQQRPVNVYRFITKGTIEQKIVDLHHTKRDLADNLLAGSDNAGKLSTEDLINLLTDNQLAESVA